MMRRCEHGFIEGRYCPTCREVRSEVSREQLEDLSERFSQVITMAQRIKARMQQLGRTAVRVRCPEHPDEERYITARLSGSRQHLHMTCEVENCIMRIME